jgi:hypothetical protein
LWNAEQVKPIPLRSSLPHPRRGGRATDGDGKTVCLISFLKATTATAGCNHSAELERRNPEGDLRTLALLDDDGVERAAAVSEGVISTVRASKENASYRRREIGSNG